MRALPLSQTKRLVHLALIAAAILGASACRKRSPPLDDVSRFALDVVAAANSKAGIGPELVDDDLVERIRRIQLVKRTTMDTWAEGKLLEAFHGETGPDRQYALAERPQKQRERATRGLLAALHGKCNAKRWDEGEKQRVAFLVHQPVGKFPAEIVDGMRDLEARLATAEMARVTCTDGDVAMLVVRTSDGRRRLVDLFSPSRSNVEVAPNDPTMK